MPGLFSYGAQRMTHHPDCLYPMVNYPGHQCKFRFVPEPRPTPVPKEAKQMRLLKELP